MPVPPAISEALDDLGVDWHEDVPLSRKVWWRVGGPADALVTVETLDALASVQRVASEHGLPLFPLGNGSNILVADAGVRGIVLKLAGELTRSEFVDDLLVVGGGLRLNVLLARASQAGWAGLEALVGIPGTVGGAVKMNAGTSLGEIADILVDVDVVLRDGGRQRLAREELDLRYRHTDLPEGAIVARARLRPGDDPVGSRQRMREFLGRRKATQPLDKPSCGSTFTNPEGDHAGRLIEAAGLKGHRIGGAEISERHANFFLNTGGATADDIRRLIAHAQRVVWERFGVWLVPEVQFVGAFGGPVPTGRPPTA